MDNIRTLSRECEDRKLDSVACTLGGKHYEYKAIVICEHLSFIEREKYLLSMIDWGPL